VPIVEVSNLSKQYQAERSLRDLLARRKERRAPQRVLDGIDLEVDAGEVLGILGANGAGKTTLLKILATIVRPTSGSATICGLDVTNDASLVRERVAYTFTEERSFYWRLTGRQNLEFFAALDELNGRQARLAIDGLATRLNFGGYLDKPFASYSSGMKQRLVLARALLRQPAVLLMDEPSRSLDAGETSALWSLIRDDLVKQRGVAVVLVTHHLDEAAATCDRVATLRDGRLQKSVSAKDLNGWIRPLDRLTFSAGPRDIAALSRLRSLPGVQNLMFGQHGESLEFEILCEAGDKVVREIFIAANAAGAQIKAFEPHATPGAVLSQAVPESSVRHG